MQYFRIPLSRLALLMAVLPMVASVSACSSSKKQQDAQIEESVDVLYNQAARALDEKKYEQATRLFEEVERQHPYSKWATQAQLMAAYASYEGQRYPEAIIALDRVHLDVTGITAPALEIIAARAKVAARRAFVG